MTASAQLYLMGGLILTVGSTLGLGPNQHGGFTFLLPAGRTECFYQTATRNDSIEIEYQVKKKKLIKKDILTSCLLLVVKAFCKCLPIV